MTTERPENTSFDSNTAETQVSSESPPSTIADGISSPPQAMSASPTTSMALEPPRLSPRSVSDCAPTTSKMADSSTPLGSINAARRPPAAPPIQRGASSALTDDIRRKMQEFQLARKNPPKKDEAKAGSWHLGSESVPSTSPVSQAGIPLAGPGGVPTSFKLPNGKPAITHFQSAPAVPHLSASTKPSLAEKRGMALPGGLPGRAASPTGSPVNGVPGAIRKKPGLKLSQIGGGNVTQQKTDETKPTGGTMMDKYAEFLDAKSGSLKFKDKATLNAQGVQFAGGGSYSISLDEVETLDELGKGNYGTVFKVRHSRPKFRREGQGLAGIKYMSLTKPSEEPRSPPNNTSVNSLDASPTSATSTSGCTGIVMAMKEIRLELDDNKFAQIIMELDILHRCISPFVIDFYGAFFQEGAVYICMEFMDGGSIDKLYGDGIPENVLRKITYSTTMGLKSLKDDHNIIHRDVKPTNILVNTRGQIKICDFGVSGNLVASFAKTNIGCQSYMAPERISGGGIQMTGANSGGGTYSVQSDIWSLGLTIIECAMGRYPYPPETYNNIFSQLSAIVNGEPPSLPELGYSPAARSFVDGCLAKEPRRRPTYPMLLQHEWLKLLSKPMTIAEEDEEDIGGDITSETLDKSESDMNKDLKPSEIVVDQEVAEWVLQAIEKRKSGKLAKVVQPALHAAPLDAVVSPATERVLNGLENPDESVLSTSEP